MSVRMVILGLLQQRPLHGYEIKHIIEDHMGDWTSIAFGSIYFALNKLAEEGYIEEVTTEQEGNRPSRTIYRINEAGKLEFLSLLREQWQQVEREYFSLDICLFFMRALPLEEVKEYLRQRLLQLDDIIGHIKEHRAASLDQPQVPRLAGAIFDHSLAHMQAERAWTQDVLTKLESGDYP